MTPPPNVRAAEFFAGIGLVRAALEDAGVSVAWSNDIEPCKYRLYAENFGPADFRLDDVRNVRGTDVPTVEIATASFPCTDLSLAGNRGGIHRGESSMFWEFARVLGEMNRRRPKVIMLENVPGFATSRGGQDLHDAIRELNVLGYACDILVVDAAHFVPQSRVRMFIIGKQSERAEPPPPEPDAVRPQSIIDFMRRSPALRFHTRRLQLPDRTEAGLHSVVEQLPGDDPRWWGERRTDAFVSSLSDIQADRLHSMMGRSTTTWRTAYRRTRHGVAVWEMRADDIAGCLRTAKGGSSKQAVVEAGEGRVAVRWMTAGEYAALQGAPDFRFGSVTENKAMFGFGDAVCVPVIAWLAHSYLVPLIAERLTTAAA